MPVIATEIVDHILGFLHSDHEYTTLRKCSVIFPDTVDRHLYSQITFHIPFGRVLPGNTFDNKDTCVVHVTDFSHILVERPHVANYVRAVQIILHPIAGLPANSFQQPSVILESISESVLSILPRIESITLSARPPLSWPALGPKFRTAFRNRIRLPSIKEVTLSNVHDFSLDTFDDCKSLRRLLLSGCGRFIDGGNVSTSRFPRLSSLRVGCRPDLTRIVSWMKNNPLHTLSLCVESYGALPKFRTLIEACSTTLINLEVSYIAFCVNIIPSFFPELRLPRLEHFTFHSHICMPRLGVYQFCLPSLKIFLTSIESTSSLSSIRLTLHFQLHFRTFVQDLDWSDVAAVLVLPIFRHPIELHISRISACPSRSVVDAVSSCEQNSTIKGLLKDGKLAITSHNTLDYA